jgi:hypothetical protein
MIKAAEIALAAYPALTLVMACRLNLGKYLRIGANLHLFCHATVAFEGIEARAVDVQVQVAPGLPAFAIAYF